MFQPAIPIGGYAGWKVFDRSAAKQFDAFARQASVQRDLAYMRENIAKIESPADLIADRRMLQVALGAFGLEDEIGKKALIRRVLEEGTEDQKDFANRLNDPRWKGFAAAFGFGNFGGARTWMSSFREDLAARYLERSFERAVGESDQSFRLAMNFRREAKAIASGASADRVGWFQIMGQRPLRAVAEAAFGLPASIANLDVDRQRAMFEAKSEQLFGEKSPKAFLDDKNIETAIRRFFARSAVETGPSNDVRGAMALSLLGGSGLAAGAAVGLIVSNATIR